MRSSAAPATHTKVSLGRRRGVRQRHRDAARSPPAVRLPAAQRQREGRRASRPSTPSTREDARSTPSSPTAPTSPTTCARWCCRIADEGDFLELQKDHAGNILTGFIRLDGETVGVVANQPLVLAGCLDINSSQEGRALHPLLRLLQHPDPDAGRRPRLPARRGAGIWRHHQARRQAAVRLCRGDGAEGHGDHPQGLWRRL